MSSTANSDPRHHVKKIEQQLHDITKHLRDDIGKIDEPQCKAMFETAAEVLGGLTKAFSDYLNKREQAWQR
jgi:hypothetical protein